MISAISPIIISFTVVVGGYFSLILEGVWSAAVMWIMIEHWYIGKLFGMDPNKFPTGSGDWISLPILPWLFIVTLVIDYLILVVLIYFPLTIWTKVSNYIF